MDWQNQLELDREKDTSLYRQIFRQIREAIEKEKIDKNSKLPPIRTLSQELNINPATVVQAYELLEEEGYIYKKVGSGSFVAPVDAYDDSSRDKSKDAEKASDMLGLGQIDLQGNEINFASATPGSTLFPVNDFKTAINHVLERDKGEAFTYQKSQGFYPLRESIRDKFAGKGLEIPIEEIQIVSGAQQAIDLLAKILLDYGEDIICENPTYPGAVSAFRTRGASIERVDLEADGMNLNQLEEKLSTGDHRLIYIMSSFQNPTGICWSDAKKRKLLELAQKYEVEIIEDDCLSELHYTRSAPTPLKAQDIEGRVIYIKSFSKIFMPGLRLAFLTLPQKHQSRLLAAKHATDISTAGLTQRAMDYYLREKMWDNHIENMRELFASRFEKMYQEIDNKLQPEITPQFIPEGGLYFWLRLPQEISSEDFYNTARQRQVALLPGKVFISDKTAGDFFRLSFAAVNEEQIERGITKLARITAGKRAERDSEDEGYIPLV